MVGIQSAKFRRYKVKSFLVVQGEKNNNVFFIFKGLVRAYTINDRGEEITASIHRENQFFSNIDSILLHQVSQFYFEALEPTYVGFMEFEQVQTLLSQHRKLEETRRFFAQQAHRQNYARINSFVLLTPRRAVCRFYREKPRSGPAGTPTSTLPMFWASRLFHSVESENVWLPKKNKLFRTNYLLLTSFT